MTDKLQGPLQHALREALARPVQQPVAQPRLLPQDGKLPMAEGRRRVWLYVKDHPGVSQRVLADVLGLDRQYIARICLDMDYRAMLERTEVNGLMHCTVPRRMEVFEEYPVNRPDRIKEKAQVMPTPEPPTPVSQSQVQEPAKPAPFDIESLTLKEARQLYNKLAEYFGDRK